MVFLVGSVLCGLVLLFVFLGLFVVWLGRCGFGVCLGLVLRRIRLLFGVRVFGILVCGRCSLRLGLVLARRFGLLPILRSFRVAIAMGLFLVGVLFFGLFRVLVVRLVLVLVGRLCGFLRSRCMLGCAIFARICCLCAMVLMCR